MKTALTTICVLLCLGLAVPAYSGHVPAASPACVDACQPTGCSSCGQKTCRLVCAVKEIKKVVWVVECEEFCVPCPRCPKGCCLKSAYTGGTCGDCCEGAHPACADSHRRCLVPPKCGKVRCRKKLIKKEITCKVPIYRCVVCGACCAAPACTDERPAALGQSAVEKQAVRPAPLPAVQPLPNVTR